MIRMFMILSVTGIYMLLFAETFKESVIHCEPTLIYACTEEKCEQIAVVNLEGTQYFEIDTSKDIMTGKIGDKKIAIVNILHEERGTEAYSFFGTHADSAYDWIARINKKNGNMTLVVVKDDKHSFSIYGTCNWKKER